MWQRLKWKKEEKWPLQLEQCLYFMCGAVQIVNWEHQVFLFDTAAGDTDLWGRLNSDGAIQLISSCTHRSSCLIWSWFEVVWNFGVWGQSQWCVDPVIGGFCWEVAPQCNFCLFITLFVCDVLTFRTLSLVWILMSGLNDFPSIAQQKWCVWGSCGAKVMPKWEGECW